MKIVNGTLSMITVAQHAHTCVKHLLFYLDLSSSSFFFFSFCFLFFQVHLGDGVKYVIESTKRENNNSKDALSSGTNSKGTRILVIDADSSDLRFDITCASPTRDFFSRILLSIPTNKYRMTVHTSLMFQSVQYQLKPLY